MRTIVMPDGLWTDLRMQSIREKRSASEIIRKLVDDEGDAGFWGSIGDFFGGIVDAIGDFFDEVWEWLKKIGKEIWEEVKAGLAKIFVADEDGDGVPDVFWVQKEFRF